MRSGIRRRPIAAVFALALLSCYFLLPLWWLIVAATKNQATLLNSPSLWFARVQLAGNLGRLFGQDRDVFLRWIGNSLIYAGGGALVATVLSAMAGYALGVYAFRGREALFSVVIASVLIPVTVLSLPLFLLMSAVHLTGSYLSVLIPSVVSPFGVYLARIFAVDSVPVELLEAGRIDGAGELRLFATVGVRLMSPGLVTIFLFQFVTIWNNYFLPLVMLSDRKTFPVTLGLATWDSYSYHLPYYQTFVITGAFVSVIPLLIAFLLLQRLWRAGLAAGGLKG